MIFLKSESSGLVVGRKGMLSSEAKVKTFFLNIGYKADWVWLSLYDLPS